VDYEFISRINAKERRKGGSPPGVLVKYKIGITHCKILSSFGW